MIKTIVVAKAENNAIGKDNGLLWHLPDDFKFFKKTTTGHHMIMGRKTYESMGKPLPNRTSIVVTRNKNYQVPEGHYVVNSFEEGVAIADQKGVDELMVIGGAQIYNQSLEKDLVDYMIITEVKTAIEDAEAFFPVFSKTEWKEISRVHNPSDDRHKFEYDFVIYKKDN